MSKRSGLLLLNLLTLGAAIIAIILLRRMVISSASSPSFLLSPWLLGVAAIVFLVQEGLTPVFAALALKSVGQSTRYKPQLLITILATSANSAAPIPAGMPIRAFLQKQVLAIPYTKSASAILIETAVGYGLTFLAAIITSLIWLRQVLGQQVTLWQNSMLIFVTGLVILFLVLLAIGMYIGKRNLTQQMTNIFYLLLQAKLWPLLGMVFIFGASLVLATLRLQLILLALGTPAPVGPLMAATLVSRIAGVLSFLPMGIGVRDASLASLLFIIGIPAIYATAAAAIDRVIMIVPYLIGGVIATRVLGQRLLVTEQSTSHIPPASSGEA